MNIKKYLSGQKAVVDRHLRKYLFEKRPSKLSRAMRYSVLSPGKRIRPIILMASAAACGLRGGPVIPVACSVEIIHAFTLIHDDLPSIDNSSMRRGRPSCHRTFGEETAILAGDALSLLAFEVIVKHAGRFAGDKIILSVIEELLSAAGSNGVIGGELMDIEFEGRKISPSRLLEMYSLKTASLFRASARCGAILAGDSSSKVNALSEYGEKLGLAFQIADDILDVTATSSALGKPAGSDVKKGKATYPAAMGIDRSRAQALELAEKAISALGLFGRSADPLREIARFTVNRKK